MPDPEAKPTESTSLTPEPKRRVSPVLIVLVVGLLTLIWQREEIAFRFNMMALERAEVPTISWMREAGMRDDHALIMARSLWSSGRLAHRRAVIDFLRAETTKRPQLLKQCEPMLLEATHDPDHSLRELLISGLKRAKIPSWREAAQAQLYDADPAIKIFAINYLRTDRVTNALPRIGELIHDPDAGVAFAAAVTIEAFAEQDFGLESWMGISPTGPASEDNGESEEKRTAAFESAVAWWRANRVGPVVTKPRRKVMVRELPELKFAAIDHREVTSAAWRGVPTFMQFFATYCASCDQVLPEVKELHRLVGDKVKIVGVSLDAIPDDHNHFFDVVEVEGHEGHDHHHHHDHGHGHGHHEVDTKAIVKASSELVARYELGFDVLYDVTGEATTLTDGGEIPVGIVLDADGNLLRRFVGPRSSGALQAMLQAEFPNAFGVSRE